jgi:hypothetical protein
MGAPEGTPSSVLDALPANGCVRATFEGLAVVTKVSHAGNVEEISYALQIERITSTPVILTDRTSAGDRPGQSIRVPDLTLPVPGEPDTSPRAFRNVAVVSALRDPSSNRVTGWLVADREVPPPADPELPDEPAPAHAEAPPPAWDDADALTVLEGVTSALDLSGRLGSVSCTVRDAASGARCRGVLEIRTAGATTVARQVEFERDGVTLLGPPGSYVADVTVVGHAATQAHFTIVLDASHHVDVLLEPDRLSLPTCTVELRWDEAEPELDLHVLHMSGGEVLAHTWFGNRGTLDHWPFCEYSAGLGIADARARVSFQRLVTGPVRCAVFLRPSSSSMLASFHALGARLTILNSDGSERRSFRAPAGAGNLWVVADLLSGQPLEHGTLVQVDEGLIKSAMQASRPPAPVAPAAPTPARDLRRPIGRPDRRLPHAQPHMPAERRPERSPGLMDRVASVLNGYGLLLLGVLGALFALALLFL